MTATILGVAQDSSLAALPGVKVTATNLDTNLTQQATTDAAGQYRILALPAGRYKVEAELAGFQKFLADNIVLTVNDQHRVDITLQVGNLEQQVEVSASPVQVETTATQLGQVIDDKKMLSLPLNGRSYIDLLGLQAGVAPASAGTGTSRSVSGNLAAGNISVNGQREASNAFLVNGGDVSEGEYFGAEIIPNLDSVAEFRLITNSFDAEYGRFSGAVMNAITKSGTNGFHGTAFEFLRNDKMDARGFFDPKRGVLKRNQFGYAVGGPAIKDKLFWFTDYQGTRQSQGASTGLVQVLTPDQRAGNIGAADLNGTVSGSYWAQVLSQRLGYTVTNNEPYSAPGCSSTAACVFPGGVIPARAFSPVAANLLKYIPLPNSGSNIFTDASQTNRVTDNKAGQRVDFLSKKTGNWYGYYHFDDATVLNPLGGASFPGFPTNTPSRAQQGVLANVLTLGPTAVNEARLNFVRSAGTSNQPGDPGVALSSLGFVTGTGTLGIIPSGPANFEAVPPISLNTFHFGRAIGATGKFDNTWHASETFSKIYKTHAFKFGGEYRYLQINERNIYAPNGNYSFDGSESGSDIADYLLGAPSQYVQASFQVLDSRTRYGGAFAEDSWRVKPNFTVNYGLRWEFSTPWYDTQDKIETIVPGQQSTVFPGAPKGWLVPGDAGIPSTLAPTRYNNFGPRLGLAWSPNASGGVLGKLLGGGGQTSIRAAFGMYYTAIEDATLFVEVADAPYGLYWVSINPPLFDQPFKTRADGSSQTQRFPFLLPVPGSAAIKNLDWSVFLPITGSPGYLPGNALPYAEHYNVSIQRQVGSSTVATLAFVGTAGHKLIAQYEANPGNPALCLSLRGSGVAKGTTQCGPNQENTIFTRPDNSQVFGTRGPLGYDFGSNTYEATTANSLYNSFQASLERRASDFTFLAAYTFSKAMDNASGFGGTINFTNFALSRALSSFDVTHNFVISYNYAVPFNRAFRAAPRRLTEGWTLNGITRFATGFPISIGESGDRSLTGAGGVDHPNFVGGIVITDPRATSTHQYFNKSAFTAEALGAYGNSNPRFFHGPGFNNWDFGLQKITAVRESMSVQFRAEFFNMFNHAQFNNPGGNFTSGTFGRVTSAKSPRIGQMSLKFLW
ncbi:MAG TPA: carboxypeptidase regulatory-like domain-containing protein [Bryobacterales bacterium]|nr:carboxypeptidase regulatory-like domain-containing protein [Bryobacterales bacterium]